MLAICPRCSVRNLPHVERCAFCGQEIQPAAQAAHMRREWDLLSPNLRDDVERAHLQDLRCLELWRSTLRAKRPLHAVFGALLFGALTSFMYLCWWHGGAATLAILSALMFAVGGAAGWLINARGGGQLKGALIFEGAFLLSFIVTVGVGLVDFPVEGRFFHFTVRAFCLGSMAATFLGLGFGRYLAFDRHKMY